jgi:hypothetical protein
MTKVQTPDHASLKINPTEQKLLCPVCGAGGGWGLASFLLGTGQWGGNKGPSWKLLSDAERTEVTGWLHKHGLLPEEEKSKSSREAEKQIAPILRTHIYWNWETGTPLALRTRHDTDVKSERFR